MTRPLGTGPARRALADVVAYPGLVDRRLAVRRVEAIEEAPGSLIDSYGSGSLNEIAGVRRWRVRSLPFTLIYEADCDSVVISDVYHTAQDRPSR